MSTPWVIIFVITVLLLILALTVVVTQRQTSRLAAALSEAAELAKKAGLVVDKVRLEVERSTVLAHDAADRDRSRRESLEGAVEPIASADLAGSGREGL